MGLFIFTYLFIIYSPDTSLLSGVRFANISSQSGLSSHPFECFNLKKNKFLLIWKPIKQYKEKCNPQLFRILILNLAEMLGGMDLRKPFAIFLGHLNTFPIAAWSGFPPAAEELQCETMNLVWKYQICETWGDLILGKMCSASHLRKRIKTNQRCSRLYLVALEVSLWEKVTL